ncbi:uncharacterized protein [Pleurodeles waltl]|uniref:uncharacterized protein n=1 Tax=Pleurodeles waltl TaxID=8319 RepID=UPI003709C127
MQLRITQDKCFPFDLNKPPAVSRNSDPFTSQAISGYSSPHSEGPDTSSTSSTLLPCTWCAQSPALALGPYTHHSCQVKSGMMYMKTEGTDFQISQIMIDDASADSPPHDEASADSPPLGDTAVSALSPDEDPPASPYLSDTPACSPSPGDTSADSSVVSESPADYPSPEPETSNQTTWYYDDWGSPAEKMTCSVHNVNACNSSSNTVMWQRGSSIAFLSEPKPTSDPTEENGKSDDVVRATTTTPTWQ